MATPVLEPVTGGGAPPPLRPEDLGHDRPQGGGPSLLGDPARFGLLAFLGTVSMLFIGFSSAYILRRASPDWRAIAPPVVLWLNTGLLVLSSLTLETARRRLRGFDLAAAGRFTSATVVLGFAFLGGQVLTWRALQGQGVFLATNPHSAFFYLLTAVHALHLLGGLGFGVVAALRVRRLAFPPGEDGLRLFATYWHFLGALWLYLLFLLFVY